MLPEIHQEQLRDAVEQTVRETLSFADITAPPVDAFVIAVRLGLTVARDRRTQTRARFVELHSRSTAERQGVILLADDARRERRHWAVAHEIGEHLARRVFEALAISPDQTPSAARETVANQLASSLLLPYDWFRHDGVAHDWELFELKKVYNTASHELLARRMLQMPAPVWITLFDNNRRQWRNSNRGQAANRLSPVEVQIQERCHTAGTVARLASRELPEGVASVRAWPIHEPDWKREIMRTELADL